MALMERQFPIMRQNSGFFDPFFSDMQKSMAEMDQEMQQMRAQMFHLFPHNEPDDIAHTMMQVKRPIIEEKGTSKFFVKFDVSQFRPEEVQVKVMGDNLLQVQAKHEEKSEHGMMSRLYLRQYQLPKGVIAEQLKPELTKDGVLTIEAPAPALAPQERMIPIEYRAA